METLWLSPCQSLAVSGLDIFIPAHFAAAMDGSEGTIRALELVPGGNYDASLFKLSRGKVTVQVKIVSVIARCWNAWQDQKSCGQMCTLKCVAWRFLWPMAPKFSTLSLFHWL